MLGALWLVLVLAATGCVRQPQLDVDQAGGGNGLRQASLNPSTPRGDEGDTGDEGRPVGVAGVDPCSLITQFEIIDAGVGGQPGTVRRDALPILVGMPMCSLQVSHEAGDPSTFVLGVWSPGNAPEESTRAPTTGRQAFDGYIANNEEFDLTKVEDLGDGAVWDDGLKTLLVLQDDRVIGVTVFLSQPDAPDPRQVASEIVNVVLPRLPQAP